MTVDNLTQSKSSLFLPKAVKGGNHGNLAKKPVPNKRIRSDKSQGNLFETYNHDISQISDLESQELEHRYPFKTRLKVQNETNELQAFRLFIKRPNQFENASNFRGSRKRMDANRSVTTQQPNRYKVEPITKGRFGEDRDAMLSIRDSAELTWKERKTLMQQNIRLM